MSGKNFTELEVGAWYRLECGKIGVCVIRMSFDYPFAINGSDANWSHCVTADGFYLTTRTPHEYNVRERVANAQGDPWKPEQPPQSRPFKVGDVVRITDKKPEDYTGKGTALGWCIPMRKHLGEVGEVRRVDRNCVEVWVDELNDWWAWLDRDLTLIKAVDEPEQPQQPRPFKVGDVVKVKKGVDIDDYIRRGYTHEAFRDRKVRASQSEATIRFISDGLCDCLHKNGTACDWLDRDLTLIKAVDEPEQPQQVEEAPKAEEVRVNRTTEIACSIGIVGVIYDSSESDVVSLNVGAMSHSLDMHELPSIIAVLTRLRDELRGEA